MMVQGMKYIRVETINIEKQASYGGFVGAAETVLAMRLGVSPDRTAEEWKKLISESEDPEVKRIYKTIAVLTDMPHPDIYTQDKDNRYCLFNRDEYKALQSDMEYISTLLYMQSNGRFCLAQKVFNVPEQELLYEDEFQVVISKETYTKYVDKERHIYLFDLDMVNKYDIQLPIIKRT